MTRRDVLTGRLPRMLLVALMSATSALALGPGGVSPALAAGVSQWPSPYERDRVIAAARQHIGQHPYGYSNGENVAGQQLMFADLPWDQGKPFGLDCVGFVYVVFRETGHSSVVPERATVPHMYRDYLGRGALDTIGIENLNTTQTAAWWDDHAEVGDIVFFKADDGKPTDPREYDPQDPENSGNLRHVAIYAGGGHIIHMSLSAVEEVNLAVTSFVSPSYKLAGVAHVGFGDKPAVPAILPPPPAAMANILFDVTGQYTSDATGASYHPLTPPRRVMDTRVDPRYHYGLLTTFQAYTKQTLQLWNSFWVPAGATAITGNLTVTGQTKGGYITLAPAGILTNGVSPATSTLNFPVSDNRANGVTVGLSANGGLDIMYCAVSGAKADAILDVTGYFANDPGLTYHPLSTPVRVMGPLTLGSKSVTWVHPWQVTTRIPFWAKAVTGNVTVVADKYSLGSLVGYVTVAPYGTLTDGVVPSSSTINFPANDIRANGVTVGLSADGGLNFQYWAASGAKVQVLFDITGYFSRPEDEAMGLTYHPLAQPWRVVDSRDMDQSGGSYYFRAMEAQSQFLKGGVLADAEAVTGNVTVLDQACRGYVTVAPGGTLADGIFPATSTINFPHYVYDRDHPDTRDIRSNNLSVMLSEEGWIDFQYVWKAPTSCVYAPRKL